MVWPSHGRSGLLLMGDLQFHASSFSPKNSGDTVNYYGIGPDLLLGYLFYKKVDAGVFFNDSSAAAASFEWNKKYRNVDFLSYGGHLGVHLSKDVFLALRGGMASYSLLKSFGKEYETPGKWVGPTGSIILGASYQMDKNCEFQVALEVAHANLSQELVKHEWDSLSLKIGLSVDSFIQFFGASFKRLLK